MLELDSIAKYDESLFAQVHKGVKENQSAIDKIIAKAAPQWKIEQIKRIDLEILRIAIFEGFIGKITPPKVAIDEAIELAKDFGGETSSKFVNGVLGGLYEKPSKTK